MKINPEFRICSSDNWKSGGKEEQTILGHHLASLLCHVHGSVSKIHRIDPRRSIYLSLESQRRQLTWNFVLFQNSAFCQMQEAYGCRCEASFSETRDICFCHWSVNRKFKSPALLDLFRGFCDFNIRYTEFVNHFWRQQRCRIKRSTNRKCRNLSPCKMCHWLQRVDLNYVLRPLSRYYQIYDVWDICWYWQMLLTQSSAFVRNVELQKRIIGHRRILTMKY